MNIAIYSRKSKFTGKGESIANQIQTCREYAESNLKNIDNIFVYEDEGFSAKDTDRPEYKRMMSDARKGRFKALICYRLDRLSRNVSNFSGLLETLQVLNIDFISVNERFDTSTPMGRAMIYIASVFAQLERETTAERVRDNMHNLARTGRWLGGRTPLGFNSKSVTHRDNEGNKRTLYKLTPVDPQMDIVRLIFQKYVELGSVSRLEGWLIQQDIRAENGRFYEQSSLTFILRNPVYCIADELVYEYFEGLGADIANERESFDGTKGLMTYNRHDETGKLQRRDESEWIVAIGQHKGEIPASQWVQVQQMMKVNSVKAPRRGTGKYGLLIGVLKCSCGSPMKISVRKMRNGMGYHYYYKCLAKERSRGQYCKRANLNGLDTDTQIVERIKAMASPAGEIMRRLEREEKNATNLVASVGQTTVDYKKQIDECQKKIKNLTDQLANNQSSVAAKYIIHQIEELDTEIKEMQRKIFDADDASEASLIHRNNLSIYRDMLNQFNQTFDSLQPIEQRDFIRRIVKEIIWDGENLEVTPLE